MQDRIELSGYVRRQTPPSNSRALYLAQTQLLRCMLALTKMLKNPDNMIADEVFRTIGQ